MIRIAIRTLFVSLGVISLVVLATGEVKAKDEDVSTKMQEALEALRKFHEPRSRRVACELLRELYGSGALASKRVQFYRVSDDQPFMAGGFSIVQDSRRGVVPSKPGIAKVEGLGFQRLSGAEFKLSPELELRFEVGQYFNEQTDNSPLVEEPLGKELTTGARAKIGVDYTNNETSFQGFVRLDTESTSFFGVSDRVEMAGENRFDELYLASNQKDFARTQYSDSRATETGASMGFELSQGLSVLPLSPVVNLSGSWEFDAKPKISDLFIRENSTLTLNGDATFFVDDVFSVTPHVEHIDYGGSYVETARGFRFNTTIAETDLSVDLTRQSFGETGGFYKEETDKITVGAGRSIGSAYFSVDYAWGFMSDTYESDVDTHELAAYVWGDGYFASASVGKEIGVESGVYPKNRTTFSLMGSLKVTDDIFVEAEGEGWDDKGEELEFSGAVAIRQNYDRGSRRMRLLTEDGFRDFGLMLEWKAKF